MSLLKATSNVSYRRVLESVVKGYRIESYPVLKETKFGMYCVDRKLRYIEPLENKKPNGVNVLLAENAAVNLLLSKHQNMIIYNPPEMFIKINKFYDTNDWIVSKNLYLTDDYFRYENKLITKLNKKKYILWKPCGYNRYLNHIGHLIESVQFPTIYYLDNNMKYIES